MLVAPPRNCGNYEDRVMRKAWIWLVVLVCVGVAVGQAGGGADPMAPVSWMAGKWAAEVKAPGSDKTTSIVANYEPVLGGKMLKIQTSFDGKPSYEGMMGYDAAKQAVAFWYMTGEGESVNGTAVQDGDSVLFDFTIAKGAEPVQHLQTRLHRDDADHYTWTLFANPKGAGWAKLFDVHYHRVS